MTFGTTADGNYGITGLAPATIEGTPGGVQFSVTSGSGGTSYQVQNVPTATLTITGNGSTDTLQGTPAGPNAWQLTGPQSGILDGTVHFTGIPIPSYLAVPTNPGNQRNNYGDGVNLPIHTTGGDGQPLQFSATRLPTGLSIDNATGVISGTIEALQAAVDTVTVAVTDGINTVLTSFSWTVTEQPTLSFTAVDLAGNPLSEVYAGQTFNLRIEAISDGTLDSAFNGDGAYVYGYGYDGSYLSGGVLTIYGVSFSTPGTQSLEYYD